MATNKISPDITPEAILSIVEVQKLRLQNEAATIALQEKELVANVELCKLEIGCQADIDKKKQAENRKSFAIMFGGAIITLSIFLGFLGWCMSMGKEQFVIELIRYLLYPLSAGCGFWLGRKSLRRATQNSSDLDFIQDANIIP